MNLHRIAETGTNKRNVERKPSLLKPVLKTSIETSWERLRRDKIAPWIMMEVSMPFRVIDFFERPITYQGIRFVGTPQEVFWGGYIEPFLKNIILEFIAETVTRTNEKDLSLSDTLEDTRELSEWLVLKTYTAMSLTEQKLLGKERSTTSPRRNIDPSVRAMLEYSNDLIEHELKIWKRRSGVRRYVENNAKVISVLVSIIGVIAAWLSRK